MTAYCFVWSPGFSNCTCILGALPLGPASEGATYSLAVCCECTITAAAPINTDKHTIPLILLIDFLTFLFNSPFCQTGLSVVHRAHPTRQPACLERAVAAVSSRLAAAIQPSTCRGERARTMAAVTPVHPSPEHVEWLGWTGKQGECASANTVGGGHGIATIAHIQASYMTLASAARDKR